MAKRAPKIILVDSDTDPQEKSGSGGLYPYDPAYSTIEIETTPFSIYEYLRQLEKGKLVIQPDFQRNQIWTDIQRSKFIESIILNFPLPPIYLNETKEAQYIVIDGLQRSTTLEEYYKGKFALTGIEALPKYNGRFFKDLPEVLQSRFEDKKLTAFILKPSTPMVVIYDLFNRINTGGTQLNRQEVRNCIFLGQSTKLLKELAEREKFQLAIDYGVSPLRMKDRELILRYLAFRWFDYQKQYSGDMSEYVEDAMRKINTMSPARLQKMKVDFEFVCNWSFTIWGRKNFRIPTDQGRGVISIGIFETVCNYLSHQTPSFLEKNYSIIKKNFNELLKDDVYIDAVTRSTNNKQKVTDRFRIVHEILDKRTRK